MSAKIKWSVFVIGALLLCPVVIWVASIKIRSYSLRHADHLRILSACREAIEYRGSYRNDNPRLGAYHEDDVVVFAPLPDDLPESIRALHPQSVLIRKDYVIINLSLPFCRMTLLGFRPDATQFGTFKYIDGLWFWNGNDSTRPAKTQNAVFWSNPALQRHQFGVRPA